MKGCDLLLQMLRCTCARCKFGATDYITHANTHATINADRQGGDKPPLNCGPKRVALQPTRWCREL